jgi:glycosyltransferase involved in cell wall biosynthesis
MEIHNQLDQMISLIFPVYQNKDSIQSLYHRTIKMCAGFHDLRFEFIFVNDGSTDGSLKELIDLKDETKDSRIRIIDLSRNFGQMAATIAGLKNAKGEAAIYLAADLQDPPEQCALMINEWLKGYEIVISYRESHGTSITKKITSRIFYKLMLPEAPKGGFDFVLLGKKALSTFIGFKERNRFGQYDVLWMGFNRKYLPYNKAKRNEGKSQNGFFKRLAIFRGAFVNTSYLPLRLMTYIGFGFAFSGFIYAALIVYSYFVHATPFKGWAPIMILILVMGGLIMIMLGILGEYLWRIYDEVKQRPLYLINKEY